MFSPQNEAMMTINIGTEVPYDTSYLVLTAGSTCMTNKLQEKGLNKAFTKIHGTSMYVLTYLGT